MKDLSIVIPVYKNEKSIEDVFHAIDDALTPLNLSYEIVYVCDGSPDNSWQVINRLCSEFTFIRGILLSRNFGQHAAITAGLKANKGKYIVVMDCDLQDNPAEIPKLYNEAQNGFDVVMARRTNRQDNWLKKATSKAFYSVFSYLTDTKQDAAIANFGIYSRKAIDAVISMNDYLRYFPTMIQWVGFRKSHVEVAHSKRSHGKSAYTFKALLKLALNNILTFSDKPLRITAFLGLLISLTSFFLGIIFLFKYLHGDIVVMGFTSLILSIWFLSGVIITVLGITGIYVGRIFDQTKHRPVYIVDENLNNPA